MGLERVQFAMLSLEGPDLYASAGGLGVRATELCQCLANLGFPTHLFFIGDPEQPACETRFQGNLVLHRWGQWLSARYPRGVYDGEGEKVADYASSLPPWLVENLVAPGAEKGLSTVFLAEEWQTVPAVLNLGRLLAERGLEHRALVLWNANNLFGFDGLDWSGLQQVASLTTVSRYMKHRMWLWGVNPMVVPNGIPDRWLTPVPEAQTRTLREIFPDLLLTKVGRYDPDKRWVMAIQALGELKRRGLKPRLLARGGSEHHREAVREEARRQGLSWSELRLSSRASALEVFDEMARHAEADVLEMCFYVHEDFMRVLYAGSDAVLANSGNEPFGLVGLEVMGCGGLVFTGSTGEDYARTFSNCVVVETEDPREIVEAMMSLRSAPALVAEMRKYGLRTASRYTWERVVADLFQKVRFVAAVRDIPISAP
jgi:glycosyltransferase involved in cell wall biosynthesis